MNECGTVADKPTEQKDCTVKKSAVQGETAVPEDKGQKAAPPITGKVLGVPLTTPNFVIAILVLLGVIGIGSLAYYRIYGGL